MKVDVESFEPYVIQVECPWCHGRKQIPGSRNWVAQGWVEAYCWHCIEGKVDQLVQLNEEGIEVPVGG